ncbi:MAG TPA: NACHT domain-containing protein [Amycolatopsis sp.]|uniref:NACHT domain-containing protein n=1 Tax=Amycolatopsis nalaikhensis TaxID=715472 RepID=A0ABY8XJ23_9PSEU|nr:NACHT domain-containing protein [Amycolatopsis sp. 2-2]WIV55598.1 NACHT domain-containing protein [Amycolatopsis sp. 2-2]
MSRRRRRVLFVTTGFVVAIIGVLSAISLVTSSLEENVSYGNIVASLIGMGTTAASVIAFSLRRQPTPPGTQAADEIAARMLTEWTAEIRHRRQHFGNARTVPLTWRKSDPVLAADPATVFGDDGHFGKVELKLDGRTGTNPDQAALNLAEAFNSVPSRRLVVIGKPGSGKTFLGIILNIGLLRSRTPGSAVPMFLSLSSWDPVVDSLDDWLVDTLASLHYGDDPAIPRTLLSQQLVLPILDGLDELPEHLRRPAISRINETLQGDLPLVLTCRSNEYREEITGGAPVLLRAPVVEILPVRTADVVRALQDNPRWADVVDHIEKHPRSPIGTTLTTPLMLSLFTATFERRDPQVFLDKEFKTGHAVENYLLDQLVDTAYPPAGTEAASEEKRWLTHLAEYLHGHGERDLDWWTLAERKVSSAGSIPVAFFAAVLVLTGVKSLVHLITGTELLGLQPLLFDTPAVGIFLLGLTTSALGLSTSPPTRRRGFWSGAVTGTLGVVVIGCLYIALEVSSLDGNSDFTDVAKICAKATALLASALVAGSAAGIHQLVRRATTMPKKGGPAQFLRQSRRTAVLSSLAGGLTAGAVSIPLATVAASLGGHFGERIAIAFAFPTVAGIHLPHTAYYGIWPSSVSADFLLAATGMAEVFVLAAAILLGSHPWTWFAITRVLLFVGRRAPLRAIHRLDGARDHGVLRVAGASYQFWHVTLQERLVSEAQKKPAHRRTGWRIAGVTVAAAVLITAVSLIAFNEPQACTPTGWPGLDARISRTVDDRESGCFAYLGEDDLHHLARTAADSELLAKIASVRESEDPSDYSIVVVAGKFPDIPAADLRAVLQGIAAAQSLAEEPIVVDFVYVDGEGAGDASMNALTSTYTELKGASHPHRGERPTAIVTLDGNHSRVDVPYLDDPVVIAIPDPELPRLASRYAEALVKNRLDFTKAAGGPLPGELKDGISDEECAQLKSGSGGSNHTYDLRGVVLSDALLNRAADCGAHNLLIAGEQAPALRPRLEGLRALSFDYVRDNSAELTGACRQKLGPNAPRRMTDSCIALLSGGSDFDVDFSTLLSGR